MVRYAHLFFLTLEHDLRWTLCCVFLLAPKRFYLYKWDLPNIKENQKMTFVHQLDLNYTNGQL